MLNVHFYCFTPIINDWTMRWKDGCLRLEHAERAHEAIDVCREIFKNSCTLTEDIVAAEEEGRGVARFEQ